MVKFRFLVGLLEDDDHEETGIEGNEELDALFDAGNPHVACFEYELAGEAATVAWEVGAAKAFTENFTAIETVTLLQEWMPRTSQWMTVEHSMNQKR